MNLLKRLYLAFSYGPELDQLLKRSRREREEREREENRHRLHLCYRHRQEANHSHYAEHNCDHCRLQEELNKHKAISDFYTAKTSAQEKNHD